MTKVFDLEDYRGAVGGESVQWKITFPFCICKVWDIQVEKLIYNWIYESGIREGGS